MATKRFSVISENPDLRLDRFTDLAAVDLANVDQCTRDQILNGLRILIQYIQGTDLAERAENESKLAGLARACGFTDAAKHHDRQFKKLSGDFVAFIDSYKVNVQNWIKA